MNTMKNLLIAFFILLTSDAAIAASAPVTCGSTLKEQPTPFLPTSTAATLQRPSLSGTERC